MDHLLATTPIPAVTNATLDDSVSPPALPGFPETPTSPTPLTNTGRLRRNYRIPHRYEDVPPVGMVPIEPNTTAPSLPVATGIRRVTLIVQDTIRTGLNRFGLFHEYPHRPSHDPNSAVHTEELAIHPNSSDAAHIQVSSNKLSRHPPWPFANMSIYRFMEWANTGSHQKTQHELDRSVTDVIAAPDFQADDLASFRASSQFKIFDSSVNVGDDPLSADHWLQTAVDITIPTPKTIPNISFTVPGLHWCSLVAVIKAALTDPLARQFHFSPFRCLWKGLRERRYAVMTRFTPRMHSSMLMKHFRGERMNVNAPWRKLCLD
jgi:hypothetical protein